jgi:hypothetical protein
MPGPARNKDGVQADFITGSGNKLGTSAAEAGYDALTFFNWDVHNCADAH